MHLSKKNLVIVLLILAVLGLAGQLMASGTESDPLISKSYLDLRLKELKTEVDQLRSQLSKGSSNHHSDNAVDEVIPGGEAAFKPLRLDPGAKIYFKEGTEFIMRVGEASVEDPSGNGLPNLTTGTNMTNGTALPRNNLCLSPREDGRGLSCHIEVWLLIKGGYTVVQP